MLDPVRPPLTFFTSSPGNFISLSTTPMKKTAKSGIIKILDFYCKTRDIGSTGGLDEKNKTGENGL
jgi:hypothetical protein